MKNFIKLLVCFATLAALSISVPAQNSIDDWTRFQSDDGEMSFELPANFTYLFDKEGFSYSDDKRIYDYKEMQMLNGSQGKTVMSVEIYKVTSPKSYLKELLERQKFNASKTDASQEDIYIKQFEQNKIQDYINKKEVEISHVTRFIASKTHLYIVTVANRGAKTPAFERFLASIRLNSSKTASADSAKIVKISTLTPITIQQIGEATPDLKNNPAVLPAPSQTDAKIENPTPLFILTKPIAGYTEAARRSLNAGIIRLRVTFTDGGRISKIGIVSSLPNGLTRSAFFSALRIKFVPQEKDSEPITVTKVVEYSFSIY